MISRYADMIEDAQSAGRRVVERRSKVRYRALRALNDLDERHDLEADACRRNARSGPARACPLTPSPQKPLRWSPVEHPR
jgi:hypothetical protein